MLSTKRLFRGFGSDHDSRGSTHVFFLSEGAQTQLVRGVISSIIPRSWCNSFIYIIFAVSSGLSTEER